MNDQYKSKETLLKEIKELRERLKVLDETPQIIEPNDNFAFDKKGEGNKTDFIVLDKLVDMKDIIPDDDWGNFEDHENSSQTEIVILDKILNNGDHNRQKVIQYSQTVKDFYKSILEAIVNGVWVCDKNDIIYYTNSGMAEIAGIPKEEIIGSRILVNFPENDAQNFNKYYQKAKESLQAVYFDTISIQTPASKKTFQSGWLIPIVSNQEFNGMVCTVEDVTEQKWAEEKLKLAYKRLQLAARTDPLTKLLNRRGMLERIETEQIRFERNRRQFGVVISDIDKFKNFNDTYGHDCGDFVLRSVAKLMREMIRKQDIIARWGGEEFLLIFPETDLEGSQIITERIRQKIEESLYIYDGNRVSITMTFGVTIYDRDMDIYDCIKQADVALYDGKNSGRNCVKLRK
jgi:diguanylate cyclase (GGDEF)-like protein/PAS domain S-box-containing protein